MPVTIEEAFADFSLGLYREACATPDDAVLSPAAVSLALFPAYVGCKYDAHTQIQEALLGSKATEKDTLKCFADLSKVVDKKVTSPALRVSNRIYSQNGFTISDTYKRRLANECGSCDVVSIDFSSSAVFDKDVNRWANESTGGKMKQIASADMFPLSTKMVILSAASFNGRWQCEFVSSDTSKRTFYSNPTSSSKIYMMKQTLQCMYGENDACQVLQMDYTDKLMSLLIFLPKEKFGLKRFELNLSGAKIFNLINSVHRKAVKVVIPRFGLENSFSLKRSLLKMKITHVFNPDLADFTDMTTKRGLCISSVIHKAIIEVSEKGCEAAAVGFPSTAASLAVCMEPPKEFIADHPFLFMVIGGKQKSILFIGRFTGGRFHCGLVAHSGKEVGFGLRQWRVHIRKRDHLIIFFLTACCFEQGINSTLFRRNQLRNELQVDELREKGPFWYGHIRTLRDG